MLQNLDLFAVGIATAAIGILGFVVFFNNRKSTTNRSFLFFSITTIFYGVFNYLVYQFSDPELVLWFLRLAVFFVVLHAFGIFQVFFVFPKDKIEFSKTYKFILIPLVVITALLTLTPFVFERVLDFYPDGRVSRVTNGPAIPIFGAMVGFLVLGGIFILLRKTIKAVGVEKSQFQFVLIGSLITFPLYIFFNFILPALYGNSWFIPLAPVFSLPFTLLTAYAIIKYKLLHMKVIATEFLAFLLIVSSFFEITLSKNITEIIFRSGVFVILFFTGIFLIRSVRKEVEQREKMEILSSELAKANEELKKLDVAKSEFISLASHQLRAPLTVIRGYVSMALEGSFGRLEEKARQPLRNVLRAAEQLVKLVADLLDLSRMESGKIRYEFAQNNLVPVVEEVAREFKEVASKKGVSFSFQNTAGESLNFAFDKDKIREVVVNFVDNSIKYSKQIVAAKLEVFGNRVRFSIKDDGIGMTAEDKKKLFIKFSRSEEARKTNADGMGIGLYFVKKVVEDHKGEVGAESEGLGKGSTFWFEIPLKK
ncbi:MAG: ATP-binding protein [bacterium]|nr:ATP-binding protein [bacterium]